MSQPMKYLRNPVPVLALQYDGTNAEEVAALIDEFHRVGWCSAERLSRELSEGQWVSPTANNEGYEVYNPKEFDALFTPDPGMEVSTDWHDRLRDYDQSMNLLAGDAVLVAPNAPLTRALLDWMNRQRETERALKEELNEARAALAAEMEEQRRAVESLIPHIQAVTAALQKERP